MVSERVSPTSRTETYVALKVNVDNWRWANVPFYIRVGKRLPKGGTEIAIQFKHAPSVLFNKPDDGQQFDSFDLSNAPGAKVGEQIFFKVALFPDGVMTTPAVQLHCIPFKRRRLECVAIGRDGFELCHLAHHHRINPL